MYSGVPMAPVALEEATVLQMRATPKSARRGVHEVAAGVPGVWTGTSMRTLAGLTSRWTMPASCTAASPSATSAPSWATSAGGMVPADWRSSFRSPPPT